MLVAGCICYHFVDVTNMMQLVANGGGMVSWGLDTDNLSK